MHFWLSHPSFFATGRAARPEVVAAARASFAWVPEAYWALLDAAGFGEHLGLMFYEAPVSAASLQVAGAPPSVALIADDLAGAMYGFQRGTPGVVLLEQVGDGSVLSVAHPDLDAFLRELAAR